MTNNQSAVEVDPGVAFEESMIGLIRSLGLHKPGTTPCGQPISVAEAHAVLDISREPGITQSGLALRLGLDKSTVSRLVVLLERRGWIERARSSSDARSINLRLTAAGRRANANLAAARRAKFERILRAIPPTRRGHITEALSTLLEAIYDS